MNVNDPEPEHSWADTLLAGLGILFGVRLALGCIGPLIGVVLIAGFMFWMLFYFAMAMLFPGHHH